MVQHDQTTTAIELKGSRSATLRHAGNMAFAQKFSPERTLLIGGDGIPLAEFLSRPALHWVG